MHRLLRLLPALLLTHGLWAHQVPNMTIEAEFAASGDYTLRINLDPRIFLSRQPTALPPVTADWYLNQSATEKAQTHAQAADYLQSNLELHFGTQRTEVPGCDFVALDGATSEALKPDTAETHLLATARALNYHDGFFDQSGELWGTQGQMLASTHQLVYFKD